MSEDVIVFSEDKIASIQKTDNFLNRSSDSILIDANGNEYKLRIFTEQKLDDGLLCDYWYASANPEDIDASDILLAVRQGKPNPIRVTKMK